jgi:hypothetical protein
MTEITGGCACGKVRFKLTGPPMGVGVCHCLDCQKASGGGPSYSAIVARDAFEVTKGEAKVYKSRADSGADVGRAFCVECGTPLWSGLGAESPILPVKLGALDDSASLAPSLHLYTVSAKTWHLMHEGLPRFPKMPPMAPPSGAQ